MQASFRCDTIDILSEFLISQYTGGFYLFCSILCVCVTEMQDDRANWSAF